MNKIYKKLIEVKKSVGVISKDETNPFFKSKYFDINGLIKHVEPLLIENGLLLLQPINNGLVTSQIVDVETGESIESSIQLQEFDKPQDLGSAITYYRRYTLQSLLGLQAEDDDANIASGISNPTKEPKKAWLNKGTEDYDKVIAAIQSKQCTSVDMVRKKFAVSKELASELELEINAQ